jgi:pimeloyl-ACP methyl ester carboxylesterase
MSDSTSPPTAVLVHGAFADASVGAGVITELQSDGVPVLAPPNPLRSLPGDGAYLAERVRQIEGPVLLVGHSYGGAVITVAGATTDNVVGLVYVAAFIPDVSESIAEIYDRFPKPRLPEVLRKNSFPLDGTARPRSNCRSRPRHIPASSLRVCRLMPRRRRPSHSDRLLPRPTRTRPRRRPGGRSPRGPSSPAAPRRSTRTQSASWPTGPTPRRSRSSVRTR